MDQKQARIILWSAPRSLSTAFARAISNRPGTKIIVENYYFSYYFGSERVSSRFNGVRDVWPDCTFADMKRQLEQDYSEYNTIFSKQMAYHMVGRMKPAEMPKDYMHTFIIRNPRSAIHSLYKFSEKHEEWQPFDPNQAGVKEVYDMFTLVTDTMKQPPIVVDAEDLRKNPEGILRAYCTRTGMDFHKDMLHWSTDPEDLTEFTNEALDPIFYEEVLQSSGFKPYKPSTVPELPPHIEKVVQECMPYYEIMCQHRIQSTS